jgi:hypothetical protein
MPRANRYFLPEPVKSTTNAKGGTERFGRTVIMLPLLKPTSTCTVVLSTLT